SKVMFIVSLVVTIALIALGRTLCLGAMRIPQHTARPQPNQAGRRVGHTGEIEQSALRCEKRLTVPRHPIERRETMLLRYPIDQRRPWYTQQAQYRRTIQIL